MFRYILEPFTGMSSRHECPSCGSKKSFKYYIDVETGLPLGDGFGRCNKEIKCGYHKSPSMKFESVEKVHPDLNRFVSYEYKPMDRIAGMNDYGGDRLNKSNFRRFIESTFVDLDRNIIEDVFRKYDIKVTHLPWDSSVIFYQKTDDNTYWAGKIMDYDKVSGKRIKTPTQRIQWAHKVLSQSDPDFRITQKLFGEHLIDDNLKSIYMLVESEKTAIIGSIHYPEYIWLATGGISSINDSKLAPLLDKKVIAIPDVGAEDYWKKKLPNSFDIVHLHSVVGEKMSEGEDLADYIIKFKSNGRT